MKKVILILGMIIAMSMNLQSNMIKNNYSKSEVKEAINITKKERRELMVKFKTAPSWIEMNNLNKFLDKVAMRESGNNPKALNPYGYMGKFQFGKAALKDLGYNITPKQFKENPNIFDEEEQSIAMIRYMKKNKRILRKLIKKYKGSKINGIEITESGIYAAAHLAGAGNVIKYLKTGGKYNPSDANGTQLENYLKDFSGYDFDLDLIKVV